MGGLLSSLNLGASALLAQQAGVAVSGRNTANVNTAGYQKESVLLESQPGTPLVGGVTAGSATRASDDLLSTRERSQSGASGRAQSLSAALNGLQQSLTSDDVAGSMGNFFGAVNSLQVAPTDTALRSQVLNAAQTVATQFNAAAKAITQSQSDADAQITTNAQQATQLAAQIASLNKSIATSNDPVLADQRDQAAKQLAGIMGGQGLIGSDGKMNFVLGNGTVLVDGTHASTVQAVPDTTNGNHVAVQVVDGVHKSDVTNSLDGGTVAGLVQFRDGTAATAATQLDQLANDFATQLNAVHSANIGLDGSTGNNLYTISATVAGSAASIAVNPAIVADPDKLATRAVGAGANDGTGATALLALRDQTLAGGGTATFTDQALNVTSTVGSDAANAASDVTLESTRDSVLQSARDSTSGVDINEEMSTLAQFQHAAEAATQFVSTVNTLLEDIITNL
jgi:flagellar hook-associated protein 1 FlgK